MVILYARCILRRPDDDGSEADLEAVGNAKISQFFVAKSSNPGGSVERHRYFVERGLLVKTDL